MDYFIGFLIGIGSSFIASLLFSWSRQYWINLMNAVFRNIYPKIEGRYLLGVPKELTPKEVTKVTIEFKQFGAHLTGTITTYAGNKISEKEELEGRISPSRYLFFTYHSITADHNQFGTGLYKISNDAKRLHGYISYICINCEDTYAAPSVLNYIEDNV
jgi:hypothetical protein